MKQTHQTTWNPTGRKELHETWVDDIEVTTSVYVGGPYPDSTCSIDVRSIDGTVDSTSCLWLSLAQLEDLAKLIDVRLGRDAGTTVLIKAEQMKEPVAKPEW